MSTEFYNTQWQMPNEANKSKSANYSLNFDGTSSKITCANSSAITGDFSISLWVNQTTTPGVFGYLIEQDGSKLRVGVNINNTIYFQLSPNSMNSTTAITNGSWAHLVLVKNGSSMNIYIDSVAQTSATAPASHTISSGDLAIGHQISSTTYGFSGKINELAIFDYALSSSQVTTLWGGGTSVSNPMALSPAPKAYYKLSDSVWDGSEYITANNAAQDYVFDFIPNDSIDTNFTLPNYSSYSIGVWYKKTGEPGEMPTGGDYFLWGNYTSGTAATARTSVRFNGTNKLRIITGNDTVAFQSTDLDVSTLLLDGKWHHILTTTVSGEIKLYIDGNLQATHTNSAIVTGIVAGTSYKIGQSGYNTAYLDESLLSNFQIFDTALIGSEAQTLYNYGSPIQTLANIPQNSNLKAWYKLDASEIYNSSSTEWSVDNNTYPSTYTSSLKFVASELDRIDMPYDTILNPSSNYTFSIWFNPTSINSNSSLFGSSILNRGVNMYYPPNNTKVTFYHKTSTANENFDIVFPDSPVDTWNNVTVTWSASTGIIRAFINGKYISQKENISDIVWGGTLKVSQYTSYGWYFDGQLSNLAMWDVTLTDGFSGTPTNGDVASGQVAEVYNNGQPQASITGSPVGWWKLNNGGKFITDSSGNNFTATNHSGNFQTGGAIEYAGFVNTLAGESLGMNQSNLVQSDLQTVAPFSKYALNFDAIDLDRIDTGVKLFNDMTSFTASIWAKGWSTSTLSVLMSQYDGGNNPGPFILTARHNNNTNGFTAWIDIGGTFYTSHNDIGFSDNTKWINLVATWDGSNIILYINGIAGQTTSASGTIRNTTLYNFFIGGYPVGINSNSYDGELSNCSVWNTALSAAQVREVYNEGLPSDLNTFSGTAPVAWWKLGEGVSYDGTSLIVQDYKGNNHGTSYSSMDQTDIVNGVGTSLNGASSGFNAPSSTVTNIVSDAPYSDKNAVSVNMQSAKPGSGIDTSTPQAT